MNEAEVIRKACEAYMLERWDGFRELAAKLTEDGKKKLVAALYIP